VVTIASAPGWQGATAVHSPSLAGVIPVGGVVGARAGEARIERRLDAGRFVSLLLGLPGHGIPLGLRHRLRLAIAFHRRLVVAHGDIDKKVEDHGQRHHDSGGRERNLQNSVE
jgi:hypothetical protein